MAPEQMSQVRSFLPVTLRPPFVITRTYSRTRLVVRVSISGRHGHGRPDPVPKTKISSACIDSHCKATVQALRAASSAVRSSASLNGLSRHSTAPRSSRRENMFSSS